MIDLMNHKPFAKLYLIEFKLYQETYYCFWYTDELDGFLLDDDYKIKSFSSQTEARLFAESAGFKLNEEVLSLSTDILSLSDADSIDCDLVLTCWNLFSDAARSVNCPFSGDSREDDIQRIYNKLFCGCNLPAVKNDGEVFSPAWEETEKHRILAVLENGFKMIAKVLHFVF